jgi:predicted PurR-regulated permease PerM
MNGERRRRTWIWGLAVAAVLVALVWAAPGVCTLLLASFILAYACVPVVDWLERHRVARGAASLLVLLGGVLVLLGFVLLFVPVVVTQAKLLAERLPEALDKLQFTIVPWVETRLGIDVPDTGAGFAERVRQYLPQIGSRVAGPAGQIALATLGGVKGVLSAVANLVLIPFLTFHLMLRYHTLWPRVERLVPPRHVPRVRDIQQEIDGALSGFVRGQLTVALILGGLLALGLSVVGIEGAIVIGLMSGLLNMVPFLGTAIGLTLALLMAVLSFSGWMPILGVLAVFAVMQTLEGYVITPRIVGDRVGLSPVVVVLAVLAGGEIFGFVGLLLAVPMAAILKVLLRVAREEYFASSSYGREAQRAPAPAVAAPVAAPPPPSAAPPPPEPGARS